MRVWGPLAIGVSALTMGLGSANAQTEPAQAYPGSPEASANAQEPAEPELRFGDAAGHLGLPGHIILDTRLRYEFVSQDGLEDGNALTLRARFGYEVEPVKNLSFLVEGEGIGRLTSDFADTVRFRPGQAVVADPEDIQLNRLQVRYAIEGGPAATIGRQRIIFDDARFIGNVGFRQNEQIYDAAYFDWSFGNGVRTRYVYLDRVNRIFGTDSPVGVFSSDSHIAQLDYQSDQIGTVSTFINALDFQDSPVNSQLTYGIKWNRPFSLGDWRAKVWLEGARQEDYRSNTPDFDVYYGKAKLSVGRGAFDVAFSSEWLQGQDGMSFQTPLATLHAFQGFADVFLRTPPEGLRDLNLGVTWKTASPPIGESFSLLVRGHIFDDDSGDNLLGREMDLLGRLKMTDWLTLELRGAFFDGQDPRFADRTRVWLALETKF